MSGIKIDWKKVAVEVLRLIIAALTGGLAASCVQGL